LPPGQPGTPVIIGDGRVGQRLMMRPGDWLRGSTISYQWLRDGMPITKAVSPLYTLEPDDLGHALSGKIIVRLQGFEAMMQTSAPVQIIKGKIAWSHENKISGINSVGSHLKAPKVASSSGVIFSYSWLRDDFEIQNPSLSTYRVRPEDYSHEIRVLVTGKSLGYEDTSFLSDPLKISIFNLSALISSHECPEAKVDEKFAQHIEGTKPVIAGAGKPLATIAASNWQWGKGQHFCLIWTANWREIKTTSNASRYRTRLSDVGQQIRLFVVATDARGRSSFRFSDPLLIK